MKGKGWLLDPYIEGKHVSMWLKTTEGRAVKLRERHTPTFMAEPRTSYTPDNLVYLFEEHPFVLSAKTVTRFSSIRRRQQKTVVEVRVDMSADLEEVLGYAERLREVKEVYNTGLIPVQWHLIYKDLPPSSLCEFTESHGNIKHIKRLDDSEEVEPPPLKTMVFRTPNKNEVTEVQLLDADLNTVETLTGDERRVLLDLRRRLLDLDPDVVVTDSPITTTRNIMRRAWRHRITFRFGRGRERIHGRVLLGLSGYADMGLAGLVERARFTYAPMGVSHDWEPGKTIDSRQCAEALRLGVLVPKMGGGYGFNSSAWELVRSDRGGMIFSPMAGLHENVAALDFESMFPNLIVSRNISYETVTDDGVDASAPGFMGGFTREFLERRLRFKHLKAEYPVGSREWLWCEQRQASLKLMLVVVYGYSGCYANRFANVRVFQEINRQARQAMVTALRTAQGDGYSVVYGPFDSLFVKRRDATKEDYVDLASAISEATGLPMRLDSHFKYLVLLTKTTDPSVIVANRYYGKLTDGSLFYRGIELRRHDTPRYINEMQREMMEAMFSHGDASQVMSRGVPEAQRVAEEALRRLRLGKVDSYELVISKRLRRDLKEYKAWQPHVVAAMLGADKDMAEYILLNVEDANPFTRVMPASLVDSGHRHYDRKKYAAMARRAAWNLLRPFVRDEESIGGCRLRESRLDTFF